MNTNTKASPEPWIDPDDDEVVWTDEMFRHAAIYRGGVLIRPATGKLGPNGIVRSNPAIAVRAAPLPPIPSSR